MFRFGVSITKNLAAAKRDHRRRREAAGNGGESRWLRSQIQIQLPFIVIQSVSKTKKKERAKGGARDRNGIDPLRFYSNSLTKKKKDIFFFLLRREEVARSLQIASKPT